MRQRHTEDCSQALDRDPVELFLELLGAVATSLVDLEPSDRIVWIVGEEEASSAREKLFIEARLLIDQEFRVPVIAHRDRKVDPRGARDQISTEDDRPLFTRNLDQELSGCVTIALVETITSAEGLALKRRAR